MASGSFFDGEVFTFEIGVEKKCFIVHVQTLESHSRVLSTLMNNGHMQESTARCAQLEEIEPETFNLFVEYAYTGIYRAKKLASSISALPHEPAQSSSKVDSFETRCNNCGAAFTVGYVSQDCISCNSTYVQVKNLATSAVVYSRDYNAVSVPNQDGVAVPFSNSKYPALDRNHEELQKYLKTLRPADEPTENVLTHAMLFVFAQEYMIESLAKLCLHKLHRDLMAFPVNSSNVSKIVDLLTFTYENTSSSSATEEDEKNTSNNSIGTDLRELTMKYAVCNAKTLLTFETFRDMLREGGDVVADFTVGIVERLKK